MVTTRLTYLDQIKGILIILVIVGHAIQLNIVNYEQNFVFRFIYSFHMPLFFFVSGYLANRGRYNSSIISKRAYQLLIPFVVWAFVSPLLRNGQIDMNLSLQTLMYPDRGLWFLYNLFIYSVIFNVAELIELNFRIRNYFTVGTFYIVLLGLMAIFHTKFNCTQLCYHIVFYTFGYYLKSSKWFNKPSNSLWYIALIGGGYFVTLPFWVKNGEPLFYEYINLGRTCSYLFRYGVQILGMLLFFNLGKNLLQKDVSIIKRIGTMTLGIYAVQFTILYYCMGIFDIESQALKIAVISIIAIIISCLFVIIVRKLKYIRLLLIGEK